MQTTFKANKHLSKKDQMAISSTFHFESILYGNIKAQSRCKHTTFKVFCMTMPKPGQMQVFSK